jgi:hypothetical protein
MTRKGIATAAVAAIAVIGVVGCGGGSDDSSSSTSSTALSKDEFVKQANEICAKGNDQIDSAASKTFSGGQPSPQEAQQFVTDTVIPGIQGEIDDIRALGAPAGDEDQVNAILGAAQQGVDAAKQDPSILEGSQASDPFAQADKLAKDYGLTDCAGS